MSIAVRVGLPLAVAVLVLTNTHAFAKDCKNELVVQAGEPYVSRTLGAFPSSLLAWRRAVREKYGDGWNTWFRAEDRKIDCAQETVGGAKRWICTRSARPCSFGPGQAPPAYEFTRTLRRGDEGEDVRQLQQLLSEMGYDLTIDGKYGRGTEQAVRDFQRQQGLGADGVFGPGTQAKLLGTTNGGGNASGGSSGSGAKFTRTLRRGDRGEDVSELQRILNTRGYSLTVDGVYGNGTKEAVRDFQRKNGLSPDGNLGPNTVAKLVG